MQSLLRDVRYGIRSLLHSPGLTIVAVVTLNLGIGLTTMMFSIVYATLFKGLPFPDGDRILVVERTSPSRGIKRQSVPIQDYFDFKAQQRAFTDLGAYTSGSISVSGDEKAERFAGSWITANTFDILGVRPMLGRAFRAGEDTPSGDKVVIVAFSLWKDRYASDPAIIGKRIRVNGVPHTIVGVMPEKFAFPINDKIWLPLQTDPLAQPRGQGEMLDVFGKLRPRVSLEDAAADVSTIAKRLAIQYKESNEGFGALVQRFTDSFVGNGRPLLLTMLGAVMFVLLIACANVANLLLDRAAHRSKEMGIRTALGASRSAVVRQFLVESLVLSVVATALGVGAAQLGVSLFNRAIASTLLPFFIDVKLHPQVLGFTIVLAAATTLLSGVIPAVQSSRSDINEILKDDSRGASSFRIGRISRALVMFEVALSCSLLVAAGLMVKSVAKMRAMDPGFSTANVFTARVGFPPSSGDTVAQWRFFDQLEARVAALPGVRAAALTSALPAVGAGFGSTTFAVEGQSYLADKDYPSARAASVTPKFFNVINTPMFSGRAFADGDRSDAPPVTVVNRAFAAKYFGTANPIGRRVRMGDARSTKPWLTIVGVVGNTFGGNQDDPTEPTLFQPLAQSRTGFVYITAKTAGPPLAITQGVREAVATLNSDLPLFWVQSFDEAISGSIWFLRTRIMGTLFMIFGCVALFLGSVGLYAVMSFTVSRRTRELGVRMALGARGADVERMILRQAASQLAIGMAAGLLLAFAIANLLKRILFEVDARDPIVFGGVVGVLLIVGLMASLIPATRATRIDPLEALRSS
jgi:putative ABC transport system permease protein